MTQFSKQYNTITKENINEMVISFYSTILKENGEVAQVFKDKLGDDLNSDMWKEHITILTNFWAMIALQDDEYRGNPMRAHLDLPLSRDKFSSWLVMFFKTIDSLYEPHLGEIFKNRAQNIAMNFMRNLGL